MSLLPFFQWCESSAVGRAVRDSVWAFPVIEAVHLLALALLGGMILLVDFGSLGLGLNRHPITELARGVEPYMRGALLVILGSGILLFLSEAMKCYENPLFRLKMIFLFLAILYTFTIRRKAVLSEAVQAGAIQGRMVAAVSLGLWSAVGILGRGIGFY